MAILISNAGDHYNLMDIGPLGESTVIATPSSASLWTYEDWEAACDGDEAAFIAALEVELGKDIVDMREVENG